MDMTAALMAAQTGSGMHGVGQKIGAALFGNSDASYQKGMTAGASAAQKMAAARRATQKNLAIEAQAKAFEEQGEPDLANMLRAEVNPSQFTGAQLDKQDFGWGDSAMAEAMKPDADMELLNRMNMVRDGKPVDLTKIDDHTAINPMALPGAQDLDLVTALGQAMAADERASAGKNTAHAGVYDAQAAAGGYNPRTGRDKTLTPIEAQTKLDWILAQANKKAADGEDEGLVDAWVRNEMLKAGLQPEPAADFSGVTASVDTTAGADRARPARVAPAAGPSLEAVTYLRQHPELAAAFEAKYGVPAAQYLGQ